MTDAKAAIRRPASPRRDLRSSIMSSRSRHSPRGRVPGRRYAPGFWSSSSVPLAPLSASRSECREDSLAGITFTVTLAGYARAIAVNAAITLQGRADPIRAPPSTPVILTSSFLIPLLLFCTPPLQSESLFCPPTADVLQSPRVSAGLFGTSPDACTITQDCPSRPAHPLE